MTRKNNSIRRTKILFVFGITLIFIGIAMWAILIGTIATNANAEKNAKLHSIVPVEYTIVDNNYIVDNYVKDTVMNVKGVICLDENIVKGYTDDNKIKLGDKSTLTINSIDAFEYKNFIIENDKILLCGDINIQYKCIDNWLSSDEYYVIIDMNNTDFYLGQGNQIANIDELILANEKNKEEQRRQLAEIERQREEKLKEELAQNEANKITSKIIVNNGIINISMSDLDYIYNNSKYCQDAINLVEANTLCITGNITNLNLGYTDRDSTGLFEYITYINTVGMRIDDIEINFREDIIEDSIRLFDHTVITGFMKSEYITSTLYDTGLYLWAKDTKAKGILDIGKNIKVYGKIYYDTGWLGSKSLNDVYKVEIIDGNNKVISVWDCTK